MSVIEIREIVAIVVQYLAPPLSPSGWPTEPAYLLKGPLYVNRLFFEETCRVLYNRTQFEWTKLHWLQDVDEPRKTLYTDSVRHLQVTLPEKPQAIPFRNLSTVAIDLRKGEEETLLMAYLPRKLQSILLKGLQMPGTMLPTTQLIDAMAAHCQRLHCLTIPYPEDDARKRALANLLCAATQLSQLTIDRSSLYTFEEIESPHGFEDVLLQAANKSLKLFHLRPYLPYPGLQCLSEHEINWTQFTATTTTHLEDVGKILSKLRNTTRVVLNITVDENDPLARDTQAGLDALTKVDNLTELRVTFTEYRLAGTKLPRLGQLSPNLKILHLRDVTQVPTTDWRFTGQYVYDDHIKDLAKCVPNLGYIYIRISGMVVTYRSLIHLGALCRQLVFVWMDVGHADKNVVQEYQRLGKTPLMSGVRLWSDTFEHAPITPLFPNVKTMFPQPIRLTSLDSVIHKHMPSHFYDGKLTSLS